MTARNHTGHVIGEQHPKARLSDVEVREIRARYARGEGSCASLAKIYGCAHGTIHNIVTWATRWSA